MSSFTYYLGSIPYQFLHRFYRTFNDHLIDIGQEEHQTGAECRSRWSPYLYTSDWHIVLEGGYRTYVEKSKEVMSTLILEL
jgi:hypothetical protein